MCEIKTPKSIAKGLSAAVSGILAGLASTASGDDGVQKLSRAIAQVESIAGRDGGFSPENLRKIRLPAAYAAGGVARTWRTVVEVNFMS
jgi:hypothetical protein